MRPLTPLGEIDLTALVQSEYATIAGVAGDPLSDQVVAGILDLCGSTPMGVRALFGLERTRRTIPAGELSAASLGQLP